MMLKLESLANAAIELAVIIALLMGLVLLCKLCWLAFLLVWRVL